MDFVKKVQVKPGRLLAGPERAHELIRQRGARIALRDLDDSLMWEECDAAVAFRREQLRGGETGAHASWLAVTWLTAAEDELLRTFLDLYDERVAPPPRANLAAEKTAIIQGIKGLRREPPDPAFSATARALGLTTTDLSYALWTVSDVREGR